MDSNGAVSERKAWIICLVASLFFFYEFIQMSVFNAIGTSLLRDLSIDSTTLASIASAYSYSMVFFLLPAGMLLDIFSIKKIMIFSFLLSILGTFLFSFSTSAEMAICCRMISGAGGAFAFLSCIKLTTRWFPQNKMSFVVGVIITFAFLGGAIAQTPFTFLVAKYGWQHTLRVLAISGLFFVFLICLFVKNKSPSILKHTQENPISFFKKVLISIKNKQTWIGSIYIMLMNLPIVLLGTLWGDLYLTQGDGFSSIQASYIDTLLFVGIMIGSPLFGLFSDKLNRRKLPLILGAILTLLSSLFLFLPAHSIFIYASLFFLLGFFSSAQSVGYPLIVENNISTIAGTVSGIASIIIMGGGALFKIIYGWVLSLHWQGQWAHQVPLYSQQAFRDAMVILPLSFFAALLFGLIVRETYCQGRS